MKISPENVKKARKAVGLTQTEAAKCLCLGSYIVWLRWEKGEREIHPAFFMAFLFATGQISSREEFDEYIK